VFACDVMVDFLGSRFHAGHLPALLGEDNDLIWQCITTATRNPGRETFCLEEVLNAAAPTNWSMAIHLACDGLVSDNYQFEKDFENLLANWARSHGQEVMAGIGRLMLDETVGWRLFASKPGVFHAISEEIVIAWLKSVGVEGARKIARHLPRPFLDASGKGVVPTLTEFVLSSFEGDDLTFRELCAGTHTLQMYVGDIASQRERERERNRIWSAVSAPGIACVRTPRRTARHVARSRGRFANKLRTAALQPI